MYSGQISIPKPELRGFWGDSFTKPPFKVTSAEVVILCPGVCVLWHHLNQLINTHAPNNDKHFLAPSYSLEALEGFACHSFSSKSRPTNRVKTTRVRSGLADFDHFWQISTIKFTTFWILFRVLVMMDLSILQDHNAFFGHLCSLCILVAYLENRGNGNEGDTKRS